MIKKILMLVLVLFSISCVFGADEFEFKITIDHNFGEDVVTCVLEFDGEEDILEFDEDSDEDDFEIVEDFDEYVDFDCDEELDEIELKVYDQNGDRILRETYEDEDKFDYELELVDEDEQYFEFDIKSDITSRVDCELVIDGGDFEFDFRFEDDTDDDYLEFARNFDDDFVLDCDDEIEEIDLSVFNDAGEMIYDKTYYDKELIEFDIDDALEKNEFRIEIEHNFGDDEEFECDLEIDDDNDLDESFTFDRDSSSNDLTIVRDFDETFKFDCDGRLDEIIIRIYDEVGDKIDQESYDNENEVDYEHSEGEYDFLIEIANDFEDDVECELKIDDRRIETYDFDDSSGRSDKRIEDDFIKYITLDCEEELESVKFFIFVKDDDDDGDLLLEKTYNSKSLIEFSYELGDTGDKDDEEEDLEEEEEVGSEENESDENITAPVSPSSNEIDDEDITASLNGSNLVDNGNSGQTTVSINGSEIVSDTNVSVNESAVSESYEPPKSLGTFLFVTFIVLVIVVLVLGAMKAKANSSKRRPKKNQKVDLDYLKERKR